MSIEGLIKHFEDLIDGNQETIDNGNDGDNACKQEIDTLEYVIKCLKKEL